MMLDVNYIFELIAIVIFFWKRNSKLSDAIQTTWFKGFDRFKNLNSSESF